MSHDRFPTTHEARLPLDVQLAKEITQPPTTPVGFFLRRGDLFVCVLDTIFIFVAVKSK